MKSRFTIITEGLLYVIIASGSGWAEFLISDRPISQRSLAAVAILSIVSGANALKAFLSQSMSEPVEPTKTEIVNTKKNPVPTKEEKPK